MRQVAAARDRVVHYRDRPPGRLHQSEPLLRAVSPGDGNDAQHVPAATLSIASPLCFIHPPLPFTAAARGRKSPREPSTAARHERDKRARFETFWQEYERQPRLLSLTSRELH